MALVRRLLAVVQFSLNLNSKFANSYIVPIPDVSIPLFFRALFYFAPLCSAASVDSTDSSDEGRSSAIEPATATVTGAEASAATIAPHMWRRSACDSSHFASFRSLRLPAALHERRDFSATTTHARGMDKFFSAVWWDDAHVLLGSKNARLCAVHVHTGRVTELALPVALPETAAAGGFGLVSTSPPAGLRGGGGGGMGGRPSPSVLARAAASAAGSASPATTMFGAAPAASVATPISGMYAMDRSPCGTWLATNGGAGASSSELLLWHAAASSTSSSALGMPRTPVPFARLVSHADVAFGCCWLDERVLLSGSRDGSLAVWRMPTGLEEQAAGYTHGMSGSRGYRDGIDETGDGGDRFGELSGEDRRGSRALHASLQCMAPAAVRSRAHNGAKVRALCHGNAGSGFGRGGSGGSGDRFASLGTDGSIAMWDVSRLDAVASSPAPGSVSPFMQQYQSQSQSRRQHSHSKAPRAAEPLWRVDLPSPGGGPSSAALNGASVPQECVAMCWNETHQFLAVGSQSHIAFLDARAGGYIGAVPSVDEGWGVRSLSAHDVVVTVGGALGRLSFFDIRKPDYLPMPDLAAASVHVEGDDDCIGGAWGHASSEGDEQHQSKSHSSTSFRACSGGAVLESEAFDAAAMRRFPTRCGVLCHAWDASRTRLFAAGGPIFSDLCGSYAALWA